MAASLAGAASASAASWLAPRDVSVPQTTSSCGFFCGNPGAAGVDVAVNSRGDTLMSWARRDDADTVRVQARFRPAGGSFGQVQNLGVTGGYLFGILGNLIDAGLDDAGRGTVVWVDPTAINDVAKAATMAPGQNFGPAFNLSADSSTVVNAPRVAVSRTGHVAATWVQAIGADDLVHVATHGPGGSFPVGSAVSATTQDASSPVVAVNNAGAVALAWTRFNGANSIAQARVRPAGSATFQPARDLSATGQSASVPDVAIDPAGRATVLWHRPDGTRTRVQARTLAADGAIGSAVDDVSGDAINGDSARIALDAGNNAVAVWNGCPTAGGSCAVEAASRTSGGSFGQPDPISGPFNGSQFALPNVVMDANGTAIAVWSDLDTTRRIQAAARPRGGSFGNVENLSPTNGLAIAPRIATDDNGNTVGAWSFIRDSDTKHVAQSATFDGGAPVFSAVDVPAVATPGASVGMSASAFDRFSGTSLSWNFGDGGGAGGTGVTHTYGSEGVRTVTITATDGAGNSTTTTRTISVSNGGGGIDADGDGFTAGQDCRDDNPKINPAAKEIRGNRTDEDCDGRAQPFLDVRSTVVPLWSVQGSKLTLLGAQLKNLIRGWRVTVSCKGSGCPFSSRRIRNKKVKKGTFQAIKKLGGPKTFRAGNVVTFKFTAPKHNTKFAIYKLKAGKLPSGIARCQTLGSTKRRACR